MEEPRTSQEECEHGDSADKFWHRVPFQGGLGSQIAIFFKAAGKLITRIELSEDGRAIRLLHLRPAEASWVGLGLDRSFGHHDFTTTIAILAAVDLVLGHEHGLGDPGSLVGQRSLTATIVD